jgi:hypothetical protein
MSNAGEEKRFRPSGRDEAVKSTQSQLQDLPVAELLERLHSSPEGISQAEAER